MDRLSHCDTCTLRGTQCLCRCVYILQRCMCLLRAIWRGTPWPRCECVQNMENVPVGKQSKEVKIYFPFLFLWTTFFLLLPLKHNCTERRVNTTAAVLVTGDTQKMDWAGNVLGEPSDHSPDRLGFVSLPGSGYQRFVEKANRQPSVNWPHDRFCVHSGHQGRVSHLLWRHKLSIPLRNAAIMWLYVMGDRLLLLHNGRVMDQQGALDFTSVQSQPVRTMMTVAVTTDTSMLNVERN